MKENKSKHVRPTSQGSAHAKMTPFKAVPGHVEDRESPASEVAPPQNRQILPGPSSAPPLELEEESFGLEVTAGRVRREPIAVCEGAHYHLGDGRLFGE